MNPITNAKNLQKLNLRELDLGLTGTATSWHSKYKDSAWVHVGGLPYDLTEGDVICVFSQFGEIVNLNLVRDKDTGKSRGFCFICYEDQRSTILAVDNLNTVKLMGRIIKVDHVENYKVPKEFKDQDELTKKLHKDGCAPELQVQPSPDEKQISGRIKKDKKKDKKNKKQKKVKDETAVADALLGSEKKKKKKRSSDNNYNDSETLPKRDLVDDRDSKTNINTSQTIDPEIRTNERRRRQDQDIDFVRSDDRWPERNDRYQAGQEDGRPSSSRGAMEQDERRFDESAYGRDHQRRVDQRNNGSSIQRDRGQDDRSTNNDRHVSRSSGKNEQSGRGDVRPSGGLDHRDSRAGERRSRDRDDYGTAHRDRNGDERYVKEKYSDTYHKEKYSGKHRQSSSDEDDREPKKKR